MDCKKINANLLLTMTILAALWAVPPVHAQPWLVRGTVTDASTGQPLPAATVQLADTYRGTIANDEGEYSLKVQQLPATLTVSYIGYVSHERVLTAPAERIDFALTPVPFLLDPIVVTAETSAEGIMRQVIRRKQEWRPSLASYQAQAYVRRVLENEEGIVSIGEMASEILLGAGARAARSGQVEARDPKFGCPSRLHLGLCGVCEFLRRRYPFYRPHADRADPSRCPQALPLRLDRPALFGR